MEKCFTYLFLVGCVPPDLSMKLVALVVIGVVVYINCASVKWSTKFLTAFSFGKILSLAIIIVAGMVALAQGVYYCLG